MKAFEWTDALDTGVDSMNAQHQKLIDLMNRLYEVNESGDKAATLKALNDLATYTVKHFQDEENYMASINFKDLEPHKLIHKKLLSQVTEAIDNFKNGSSKQLDDSFFNFLRFWLKSHICGIDAKYGH